MEILYKNAVVIYGGKKFKASVLINSGKIKKVIRSGTLPKAQKIIDLKNNILTAPFVDTHIHGSYGYGVDSADKNALLKLSLGLKKQGVYAFCPTLFTLPLKQTVVTLEKFAPLVGKEKGAKILGFHLEGPFISPNKLGFMREEDVQEISLKTLQMFWKAADGKIVSMTVAPEVKNLNTLVKFAKKHNILLQAGHTSATYAEMLKGYKLGIKHATHLYNAMSGLHHRDLGAVGTIFYLKDFSSEIIADGVHVCPEAVQLFLRQKTAGKVFVITDALTPTGKKEGLSNGQKVKLQKGVFVRCEDKVIAGSALTMLKAVQNLVRWGYPLEYALQAASTNPAKRFGLDLSIEPGHPANFIILDKKTLKILFTE
ncbi:MAG: N-acetylglucosamine-6-phosphate deacetylase [Elusimicrobiaceae bacterium]|nr:N-acetylglucosamine-6-phosphate deacetylase [Elusimicrobiaceae bacterium]